ncbi:7147_t:CDS:1 [Ambispora leptoticha]|uniref:7147_t:CDS:1 n=1 Tax=Ambispora leptoticha TaxID=144679 RepID=A0A9N9FLG8_9GLOM|nr:7147_t:CDS:1 [Ambispora leptoticha]
MPRIQINNQRLNRRENFANEPSVCQGTPNTTHNDLTNSFVQHRSTFRPPSVSTILSFANNDDNDGNNDLAHVNQEFMDELLSKIEPTYKHKVEECISLSLHELITPKAKSRKGKTPRPQNPFVLYRRDIQAKLIQLHGKEIGGDLATISRVASDYWKNEKVDVIRIFEFIANLAKDVHEKVFPNYVYKPRRRRSKGPVYNMDEEERELLLNVTQNYQNIYPYTFSYVNSQYNHYPQHRSSMFNSTSHVSSSLHNSPSSRTPPAPSPTRNFLLLPPLKINSHTEKEINLPPISQTDDSNNNRSCKENFCQHFHKQISGPSSPSPPVMPQVSSAPTCSYDRGVIRTLNSFF